MEWIRKRARLIEGVRLSGDVAQALMPAGSRLISTLLGEASRHAETSLGAAKSLRHDQCCEL
jgi:hypothetical protein